MGVELAAGWNQAAGEEALAGDNSNGKSGMLGFSPKPQGEVTKRTGLLSLGGDVDASADGEVECWVGRKSKRTRRTLRVCKAGSTNMFACANSPAPDGTMLRRV